MSAWTDMLSIPAWLKRSPGYQSGDYVCVMADDPGRPDPVELEQQRLEKQRVRESSAGQARERDLLDQRADRQRQLTNEGSWIAPGEVLQRFPKLAQMFAEGAAEPRCAAYGPRDERAVNAQWQADMRRVQQAQLNADGIVAPPLDWSNERHEVPR